jgi:preprotein translocase subunit SecE
MIAQLSIYLISQSVTLYYLYKLEDANCNCIMDWRHNFAKYFALSTLLLSAVIFVTAKTHLNKLLILMYVLSLISLYAFYTYIGDLEKTQCNCAVKGMYWTHTYLYYWRYLLVILMILIAMMYAMGFQPIIILELLKYKWR